MKSPTAGQRFHDMRHQAITELAEPGASEQTIMSLLGHASRKMLEHYSHIRLEAKREAVRALSSRKNTKETDGHVTERVTSGDGKRRESLTTPEESIDNRQVKKPTGKMGLTLRQQKLMKLVAKSFHFSLVSAGG